MRLLPLSACRASSVLLVCVLVVSLVVPAAAWGTEGPDMPVAQPDASPEMPLDVDDDRLPPGDSAEMRSQALVPQSGDYRIDALLSGNRLPGSTITYSFYDSEVFNGAYYGTETNVRELTEASKANVRQVLAWYSTLINVTFVEVTETPTTYGYLRYMASDGPDYAYAYYPGYASSTSGDVHACEPSTFEGHWTCYRVIFHETGHALGLKHPFEAFGSYATLLPATEDNYAYTLMSYSAFGGLPRTPMTYDLLALQHIYGARMSGTGDDTYACTVRGPFQYTVGGALRFPIASSDYTKMRQTIWDCGGVDTLDATQLPASSSGYLLDLRPGGWQASYADFAESYGGLFVQGTSLAFGTEIENVIGSTSNDTFYANDQPNVFGGYTRGRAVGSDRIYSANASDTISLAGYQESQVTRTRSGADLVLGLGVYGSVTLVDYYAGATPVIVYAPYRPPLSAVGIEGTNRYDTAIKASQAAYPDGAKMVVIATGENWPDALGGAALAGAVDGPLLLTPRASLPSAVLAEIRRLGATGAYVLGGRTAVSDAVKQSLETALSGEATRVAGGSRYETAARVADEVIRLTGPSFGGNAIFVTGVNFPDALGASPYSAASSAPILLVPPKGLPYVPSAVDSAVIVGGTAAVSVQAQRELESRLQPGAVGRIGGANRFDTAAKMADYSAANGLRWDGVGIATGTSFPDALSGGVMLGSKGSVMLLTSPTSLSAAAESRLVANGSGIATVHFIGGTGAVSKSVRTRVANVLQ